MIGCDHKGRAILLSSSLYRSTQDSDAAIYLGNRPTVSGDGGEVVLEAHALDWEGDLYGEAVAVRFTDRIRGDAAFDTFDELVEQIRRDCDEARRVLAASPDRPGSERVEGGGHRG